MTRSTWPMTSGPMPSPARIRTRLLLPIAPSVRAPPAAKAKRPQERPASAPAARRRAVS